MHLLKNNQLNSFNFLSDYSNFKKYTNTDHTPIYKWRRRFKILGMGFNFGLSIKQTILINLGKSHPFEIKPKHFNHDNEISSAKIKGYKNRILLLRLNNLNKRTTLMVHNIYKKIQPNYYRRKGIGYYNDQYKYKKGKKKFI